MGTMLKHPPFEKGSQEEREIGQSSLDTALLGSLEVAGITSQIIESLHLYTHCMADDDDFNIDDYINDEDNLAGPPVEDFLDGELMCYPSLSSFCLTSCVLHPESAAIFCCIPVIDYS